MEAGIRWVGGAALGVGSDLQSFDRGRGGASAEGAGPDWLSLSLGLRLAVFALRGSGNGRD